LEIAASLSLLIAMDAQSTRDARGAGPGMYAENAAVRRSGAFFCRKDEVI
jgi:hypothetical protein